MANFLLPMLMVMTVSGNAVAQSAAPGGDACQRAVAAVEQAARQQGLRADVECLPLTVRGAPISALDYQVVVPDPLRSGRLAVLFRANSSGVQPQQVWVPLSLSLQSAAWRTKRAINPGELVTAADLVLDDIAWPAGKAALAAGDAPITGRAVRSLRVNEPVGATDLTPLSTAFRGDRLSVKLVHGPIEVERSGVLVANSQVGQLGRVQLTGTQVVQGVLETPQLMRMELGREQR
jgi:flagella basal body P-ring formation protein FlgA